MAFTKLVELYRRVIHNEYTCVHFLKLMPVEVRCTNLRNEEACNGELREYAKKYIENVTS